MYVVVDSTQFILHTVYTYKAIYTIYSRGALVHLGSSHEGLLRLPVMPSIIGICLLAAKSRNAHLPDAILNSAQ